MLTFWRKKKRAKEVTIPQRDPPAGQFQAVWERKPMPSPGAQNYAYESLGLAGFSPIGPTVRTREPIVPLMGAPQPYVGHAIVIEGVPTTAGQIINQPLFDPARGFTNAPHFEFNLPFQKTDQPPAGLLM